MKTKQRQTHSAFTVSLIAIAAFTLSTIAAESAAETLVPKSVDTKKPVTIHVSPQGNDKNDGSAANPSASLEAGRSLLRATASST